MKNQDNRTQADVNPLSDATGSLQASLAQAGQDLRRKAEALARERTARAPDDSATRSADEIRDTLHELQVHQIELEMQNEELRKAQAEIEAGRARYFDLYDLAPVGYFTVGEKGLILEANLTAATLLGVNRAALVRQPLTRFILKEDQDLYYLLRKQLAEGSGGQAHSLQTRELRMLKPDGSFFWAHLTATATEGTDGSPACRVVLSDSTERRKSETALQENRDLLDATQRLTKVGGWEWDVTRQKMTWTDETYRIHDFDPVVVPAGSPAHIERSLACYDVEGRKRVADAFRRCIEEGEDYDVECGFISAAGRSLRVRTIGRAIRENGSTVKVMGNLQDLTELRRAEAALQESDLRFRHLLQHVPNVAVQGYGPDGTTLYWNDASERLYGYTAQEALGRNLVGLIIPPEMRDVVTQLIQQLAETGQQIPAAEVSLMRKDGSRVSVFSSHATVQIPGQPLALFCIDIDITERKAAEAQRAAAFEALQHEKDELERWQNLTVGRELAMIELKKEVNALLKQAGQPEAYTIVAGKAE